MQAAGCVAWSRRFAGSRGIFELIPHLRRLLRIRRELVARVLADPPDVYIGVDYEIQPERRTQAEGGGTARSAVRQPAGVGVAAG